MFLKNNFFLVDEMQDLNEMDFVGHTDAVCAIIVSVDQVVYCILTRLTCALTLSLLICQDK